MSKIITSPVEKFPGTVTLADPMLLEHAIAWERATAAMDDLVEFATTDSGALRAVGLKEGATISQREGALIEGIKAVVEEWNLEGIDPQRFPLTPKGQITRLLTWLFREIHKVYAGDEAPNG